MSTAKRKGKARKNHRASGYRGRYVVAHTIRVDQKGPHRGQLYTVASGVLKGRREADRAVRQTREWYAGLGDRGVAYSSTLIDSVIYRLEKVETIKAKGKS